MAYTISTVSDVGNDVLEVVATDADGKNVTAHGWVSATTNFFPADQYDDTGNLVAGAVSRAMTPQEIGVYAMALIEATVPPPAPAPALIDFIAPSTAVQAQMESGVQITKST